MQCDRLIRSLFSANPASASVFFVRHLGRAVVLEIGWFVSLVHPDHRGTEIALTQSDHSTVLEAFRRSAAGMAIAVVVADAAAVFASLSAEGCVPFAFPVDHLCGQRQFLALGPVGVLLDVAELTTPDPQWLAESSFGASPDLDDVS